MRKPGESEISDKLSKEEGDGEHPLPPLKARDELREEKKKLESNLPRLGDGWKARVSDRLS